MGGAGKRIGRPPTGNARDVEVRVRVTAGERERWRAHFGAGDMAAGIRACVEAAIDAQRLADEHGEGCNGPVTVPAQSPPCGAAESGVTQREHNAGCGPEGSA